MLIDITELELAEVLLAFFAHAKRDKDNPYNLSPRIAKQLIEAGQETESLAFDHIMGRTMHINLDDDVVDVTLYDRHNGPNQGLIALRALCESKGIEVQIVMERSRLRTALAGVTDAGAELFPADKPATQPGEHHYE